jgi:aspartate/methionine/tyrosine aminotransferase
MKKNVHSAYPLIFTAGRAAKIQEYYFSKKLQEVAQMRQAGKDIINLGIGNPDLPPAPRVVEALAQSAASPLHHGYQSYRSSDKLRSAFAKWYARDFGVTLQPANEILPLIGSKEGIVHISLTFLNPGDIALVPDPGYPTYSSAAHLAGAKPVKYSLKEENNWLPDFEELEKLANDKVKILWINYPHMPTGARANRTLFEKVIAFAKKHNILVCHDNPYAMILNPEPLSILSIPESKSIAIELNSLSKSHNMAGWRMGMAAGDEALINAMLRVKSNMDSGMFLPLQDAAVIALGLGSEWFEELNAIYTQRRAVAQEIASLLNCSFASGQSGMFLWAKVPDTFQDAEMLTEKLLHKAGVFFAPGHIFGSNGQKHLRISLCAPIERMQEALKRISEII